MPLAGGMANNAGDIRQRGFRPESALTATQGARQNGGPKGGSAA